MKPPSKWASLGERVAELKDGKGIVLKCEGNLAKEAHKVRNGLKGLAACALVQCAISEDRHNARGNLADATSDPFCVPGRSAPAIITR